jgi:hypothetical protein
MAEVRDELARIAAGRTGDTTTVLLARTELRSDAPGRSSTEVLASDGQPAAGAGAAASNPPTKTFDEPARPETAAQAPPPADPTPPPVAPAARPAPERRRRRGAGLWVAAGLLAVALVGLIAFLATRPEESGQNDDASATTSEATSPAEETTAEETTAEETTSEAAPTTDEEPTPTTTAAAADPLTAGAIEEFLASYHEQVITDPRGAYARTGPTLQGAISEDNYVEYWEQFSDVEVYDIEAADGQDTANGTLRWTRTDGSVETGRRLFTFVVQDGELILDSDRGA